MPYVDKTFYDEIFKGEPVVDADFSFLLERASEIIEEMCMYRIQPERMDLYGTFIQDRIKKAVCAQIEYLDANGGSDMDNGESLTSASLGKFSYSTGSASGTSGQSIYSPRALRLLAPTGLLYRGGI